MVKWNYLKRIHLNTETKCERRLDFTPIPATLTNHPPQYWNCLSHQASSVNLELIKRNNKQKELITNFSLRMAGVLGDIQENP